MAFFRTESVVATTLANGTVTTNSVGAFNGFLHTIVYTPGAQPLANSVVVAITGETSSIPIWTETIADGTVVATRYPRAATHTILGAAALFAAAGVAVLDRIPLANERITIAITSGGNVKSGTFRFVVGD